ncbi:MAG TPA: hypothetical protein VJJ52_07295 [Candidatus Nanoarchaeia archaeon]|nr:hypothetical protein [Candidatus Nanoarchaeia archaeon]
MVTHTITTGRYYTDRRLAQLLYQNYPGRTGDLSIGDQSREVSYGEHVWDGLVVSQFVPRENPPIMCYADGLATLWILRPAEKNEPRSLKSRLLLGSTHSIEGVTSDEVGTQQAVDAVRKLVGDRSA